MKLHCFFLNFFCQFCWLCQAHKRKGTRLSPLFRTASDEKLGGAWEQGSPTELHSHLWVHSPRQCTSAFLVTYLSMYPMLAHALSNTYMYIGIKPGSLSRGAESSLWNWARTKNWEACPLFVVTLQLQNTVVLLCAMSTQYKHAFIAFPGNKYHPVILYSTCYGLPNGTWPIYDLKLTWLSLFTKSVILLK